jgi:hypothetical protein
MFWGFRARLDIRYISKDDFALAHYLIPLAHARIRSLCLML